MASLACSPVSDSPVWTPTAPPDVQIRDVSLKEMPWDATMVFAASVLTMRGRDETTDLSPVVLTPAAKKALRKPAFRFDGFKLAGYNLTAYGEPSPFTDALMASAILTFIDAADRRATVSLVVDYGFVGRKIEIKSANVLTLKLPKP